MLRSWFIPVRSFRDALCRGGSEVQVSQDGVELALSKGAAPAASAHSHDSYRCQPAPILRPMDPTGAYDNKRPRYPRDNRGQGMLRCRTWPRDSNVTGSVATAKHGRDDALFRMFGNEGACFASIGAAIPSVG